jgi:hypothetical protein
MLLRVNFSGPIPQRTAIIAMAWGRLPDFRSTVTGTGACH